MSLYPGFTKEKETSFLTLCMAKFGRTATFLFEIWTPACSIANKEAFVMVWRDCVCC